MKEIFKLLKSCFLFSLFLMVSCNTDSNKEGLPDEENWINLLEKNNLDDWTVKVKGYPAGENYNNTFKLENGVLKVDYSGYNDEFNNRFGHIYYKEPFSNYKLRLDYRFIGNQVADAASWAFKNSGVMIHCENPNQISLNQNFPVSIEVQLLGGDGTNDRPTANLCTPGTHVEIDNELVTNHCINSNSLTYHDEQWVKLEIEVYSDSLVKHFINGEKVMEYTNLIYGGEFASDASVPLEGEPVKSGYISLQSESHPIEFKNIELLELEDF
ncbi:3-keto-disaccharide hydrolase [Winogradskyella alexanderae]|uniref:DUF1080 domain-containing protein n=1 Tax=Winogradskyella alexanderae TaxID=2877123 RepID=A0ABS7XU16_9FLAO|nr:DUF1080 domain-containing protein [Winogradskyella alexanderae]MCA0132501.1 DUF1080 domain-containing protein [Winogradskyella alexanderae]